MSYQRHWWERIPPLLLIALGLVAVGVKLATGDEAGELWALAGVLIGAGIVLEAIHHIR